MIVTPAVAAAWCKAVVFMGLVAAFMLPALAQEPLKIGFVNAGKLLEEAPQAEEARKRLEEEFRPRDQAIVEAQRKLQELQDQLTQDGSGMGDSERARLEQEIRQSRRDIERARAEFTEDFNIRRNEELRKLQRLVYDAIVTLAKDERFDLIVNDGAAIFASQRVDLTSKVLERMRNNGG